MSTRQPLETGSVFGRGPLSPRARSWLTVGWRMAQLAILALLVYAGWLLLGHIPYRIDIDVYRMGAQAWLDGRPLYAGDATFATRIGLDLPFTYPPLAAILFSPFAWLGLDAASIAITVITLVLLLVSIWIVLTRLDVWQHSTLTGEPAWLRRCWLAAGIVALSVVYLEPIAANFAFGQINVVLMTLVIADCVPRRTPWPRGLLLGIAIAFKLTPAVFLLYFVLRRDVRATVTAFASFLAATAVGFAFAWRDSVEYWTTTVRHTDRIGSAALNTNQNIAGSLARLSLSHTTHLLLWVAACFAVLGLTVWAVRRVAPAGEPALALICVALFGLMVSPVSWSHHWVWALPTIVVTSVLAYRRRNIALAVVSAVGVALMVWIPLELLPKHHEETASWWRQLLGMSYVWWALAVLVVAGLTVRTPTASPRRSPGTAPVADLVRPA
ncbi:glycosyltransferase 87 family protein [Mycobacterium sp. NBC_00419]|uniref:glycosyltransferase 87 family protein n=1 Tax=Mycobacterium sp. NBC_00419 TaxID=2975989 RepID=UPI003FA5651C